MEHIIYRVYRNREVREELSSLIVSNPPIFIKIYNSVVPVPVSENLPESEQSKIEKEMEETMSEKQLERYLVEGVKKLGGLCYKFVSPGTQGVPDRIIITAQGRTIFAELKTDRGVLSPIQQFVISQMLLRNADVRVVRGLKQVKELLAEIEQDNYEGDEFR